MHLTFKFCGKFATESNPPSSIMGILSRCFFLLFGFLSPSLKVLLMVGDGYAVQRMLTTTTTLMVAQSDGYWWSVKPTICLVCFLQINILATAPMVRQSSVTSGNIVISFCPAVPSTVRMVSCAGQCPWSDMVFTNKMISNWNSLYIYKYYVNGCIWWKDTQKKNSND